MLSFEEKIAIADSFPELSRRDVSLGRVNYHYEKSASDKKTVLYHLHPNGNGYVYAGGLEGYQKDDKGLANIRYFSEGQLREAIAASIRSLGAQEDEPAREETWTDGKKSTLKLVYEEEDQMWYVFAGLNLDGAFESYEEAAAYLREEGFARKHP